MCENISQAGTSFEEIQDVINKINYDVSVSDRYYWGDGKSSERIVGVLRNV